MKRSVLLPLVVAAAACAMPGRYALASEQSARLVPSVIDLGVLPNPSHRVLTFAVTNVGDAPLHVSDVVTDCGCLQVSVPRGEIGPGRSASVLLDFTPIWPGRFTKELVVRVSPGNQELKGQIVGDFSPFLTVEGRTWLLIGGRAGTVRRVIIKDHRAAPGRELTATVHGPNAGSVRVRLQPVAPGATVAQFILLRPPAKRATDIEIDIADKADPGALVRVRLRPIM